MSILGPIQIKGLRANDIKHVFIAFNESQGERQINPQRLICYCCLLVGCESDQDVTEKWTLTNKHWTFFFYIVPVPNPILNNNQI